MADDDYERIARKAHEIWESEGHPHGRDQAHWDQAKEIIALHDSMGDTLLPRDTGALEPEEPTEAVEPYGDVPGITDQGRDDLTDIDREPEITKPSQAVHSTGDTAGHVARHPRDGSADIDEPETVTPAPRVSPVTPTPSDPMLGEPAPREAVDRDPEMAEPEVVVPKTAEAAPKPTGPVTGPDMGIAPVVTDAASAPKAQASPVGNSASVTGGRTPSKEPPAPASVTSSNKSSSPR